MGQIGVTAENQEQADKRIPVLMEIPAAVRFVSVEPMLSSVDLERWLPCPPGGECPSAQNDMCVRCNESFPAPGCLDWVIIGAESGPNARKIDNLHIMELLLQCSDAGIPVFLKQAWINGKLAKLPDIGGQTWGEMPK